jgi:hypothetical protein
MPIPSVSEIMKGKPTLIELVKALSVVQPKDLRYNTAVNLGKQYKGQDALYALVAFAVAMETKPSYTDTHAFDPKYHFNFTLDHVNRKGVFSYDLPDEDRKLLQELTANDFSTIKKMLPE